VKRCPISKAVCKCTHLSASCRVSKTKTLPFPVARAIKLPPGWIVISVAVPSDDNSCRVCCHGSTCRSPANECASCLPLQLSPGNSIYPSIYHAIVCTRERHIALVKSCTIPKRGGMRSSVICYTVHINFGTWR
jgi:hypothetical protein